MTGAPEMTESINDRCPQWTARREREPRSRSATAQTRRIDDAVWEYGRTEDFNSVPPVATALLLSDRAAACQVHDVAA